ncbi:MAG TPA: 5'-3' exonuclease H3TH domain-containing protein, partial [Lentimicrobium sp.]|nr:5'-3' exonuclease H3TH domain-containing protein [Lentimicrobium sp.]
MSQPKGKVFFLDAMALIYRAYYALNKNPRVTSRGLNTSAILGFANTLLEVIREERPDYIGVAFDTHAPTQRHVDFVEYKSKREAVPEDILKAIPYIVQLIEAMNIPVLVLDGFEADDIIGTLATKAGNEGYQVFMMTPDKDFAQLVTENVFIYKPGKPGEKATVMGVQEVCARYCIKRPEQVKDLLGLWGDASDNIPGIPGVGEVTARKLIEEYGSVENLVENALNIDNVKMRAKVIEFGKQALLSKQLATIILDVPVEFNTEALKLKYPDYNKLKPLLEELEFRSFGDRVIRDMEKTLNSSASQSRFPESPDLFSQLGEPGEAVEVETTLKSILNTPHKYHLVDTPEKRKELIKLLEKATNISFDTETTGRDANTVELVGLSFCINPGEAWYVPVPDNYGEALEIVKEFSHIYADERIEKTGHNLKYDIAVLSWYEAVIKGPMFDTMLAHYLIEPDLRHNMDYLSASYLKYQLIPIDTLIGKKGKNQLTLKDVPVGSIVDYSC